MFDKLETEPEDKFSQEIKWSTKIWADEMNRTILKVFDANNGDGHLLGQEKTNPRNVYE